MLNRVIWQRSICFMFFPDFSRNGQHSQVKRRWMVARTPATFWPKVFICQPEAVVRVGVPVVQVPIERADDGAVVEAAG